MANPRARRNWKRVRDAMGLRRTARRWQARRQHARTAQRIRSMRRQGYHLRPSLNRPWYEPVLRDYYARRLTRAQRVAIRNRQWRLSAFEYKYRNRR